MLASPLRFLPTAAVLLLAPGLAHAHIELTNPPGRYTDQKAGPCGKGSTDARTTDPNKITEYHAGETITIEFKETIQHQSHYRVTLSSTGDSAFIDPTGYDDTTTEPPELIDGVQDNDSSSTDHSIEVTLPNEPCEECTLQLIQVMYDKMPWGPGGGSDIYYQCADIVILPAEGGGSGGAPSSGGSSGESTGGATGSGGTGVGGLGIGGTDLGSGGSGDAASAGGTTAAGGAWGSGGDAAASGGTPGVDGGVPPAGGGCSFQGQASGGAAPWLGLAGLAYFWSRRRRLSGGS